jgi:hypothetical protein
MAYAIWRNPDQNNRIECVAVPIKTMKTKVTLAVAHDAFPGLRLDPSQVDLTEEDAFRRFVDRRRRLAESAKTTMQAAELDIVDATESRVTSTYLRVWAAPRDG